MANNILLDVVQQLAPLKNPVFNGTVTADKFVGTISGSIEVAQKSIRDQYDNVIDKTYATIHDVQQLKTNLSSNYATKHEVDNKLDKDATAVNSAKASSDRYGSIIDLTYATKNELSYKLDKTSNAVSATKAANDGNDRNIVNTYATKAELSSGLNNKLDKTFNAVSATKAINDGNNRNIVNTYATKSELSSGLSNKLDKNANAVSASKVLDINGNSINFNWSGSSLGSYVATWDGNATIRGIGYQEFTNKINQYLPSYMPTSGGTFTGTVYAPVFQSTSDKRLKDNLIEIDNALDKIDQLTGYTYNLAKDDSGRRAGVIAQDVIKVLPEGVRKDDHNYYSVDYNAVIGLLVNAVKELRQQVDQLQHNN